MSITMGYVFRKMSKYGILVRFASMSENTMRLMSSNDKPISSRMKAFKQKLQEEVPSQTETSEDNHFHVKQEEAVTSTVFPPFPNNTNPETGEINGPKGPEPTRYGDWERKGRVSDF